MNKLFEFIKLNGIREAYSDELQRNIQLTNLFIVTFSILVVPFALLFYSSPAASLICLATIVVHSISFTLIRVHLHKAGRFLFSFTAAVATYIIGVLLYNENVTDGMGVKIIILGTIILPFVVFRASERIFTFSILIVLLILIYSFDYVDSIIDIQVTEKNFDTKAFRVLSIFTAFSMIALNFFLYQTELAKRNKQLEKQNNTIKEQNEELTASEEELKQQNEELITLNEHIECQKKELEKLSIVADKTDNSVLIIDKNGEIEWANDAFTRMLGLTLDEFKKKYGSNIYKASLNPEIECVLCESIKANRSVVYSNKTVTKKGREIWIQTTLTPILDENKNLEKLIAIDSDITKIKKAEQEIIKQRDELQLKNKHIANSINYAKRIQEAMLPTEKIFEENFSNHFILYKPRDIVSGDFYWAEKFDDKLIYAVADCTGHGVPGAMVSMLGISLLNKITTQDFNLTASEILEQLRIEVKRMLKQTGENYLESKDGMDIALCVIDKDTLKLQYSGAYNSLYIFRKNELIEIKANKQPIGIYAKEKKFTNHEFQLQKNDILYSFSDGFSDQFSMKNEKYKIKRFKNLLINEAHNALHKQKEILENELSEWKGDSEQIDDIVVVGIKI